MNAHDLFRQWETVRTGLYEALDKLTDEQLGFTPREELRSIGEIAGHMAGTEEHWLRYYMRNQWVPEDGPQYGLAQCPTVSALKAALAEVHDRTLAWLPTLSATDLDQVAKLPWGGQASVGWCLWHVLEHEIHHRGELYLMLGLLGLEAPDV